MVSRFFVLLALCAGCGGSPDAAPPTPDAGVTPTPDAGVTPTPDAGTVPTPDAGTMPPPDAGTMPPPDAAPPTPDAAPPAPDAAPPAPDAGAMCVGWTAYTVPEGSCLFAGDPNLPPAVADAAPGSCAPPSALLQRLQLAAYPGYADLMVSVYCANDTCNARIVPGTDTACCKLLNGGVCP